jgi:cell division protein FtsI/penicillin-binding protein 2
MPERNYFSESHRRRPVRALARAFGIILLIGVVLAAGWFVFFRDSGGPPALPAAQLDAYLKAWQTGDANTMAAQVNLPPPNFASTAFSLTQAAPGSRAAYTRSSLIRTKTGAEARYHAHVDVAGYGPIDWDSTLEFARVKIGKKEAWRIVYQPGNLYPGLKGTQRLSVRRAWPQRADIVAADGTVVATSPQGVKIEIQRSHMTDNLAEIKQTMQKYLGTDPADIDAALASAGSDPNQKITVVVVPRDARYATVKPLLAKVNGIVFDFTTPVPQTSLGGDMLGAMGAITPARLQQLGSPYRAGDLVGTTGLQAAFEKRLAGTPSRDIVIEDKGNVVRALEKFAGSPGKRVVLTIDPHTQDVAANALAGSANNAALVAINTNTGAVLAAASNPKNGFDRALQGTYPPGSTFKIVTSSALVANGATSSTAAPCAPTETVDGQTFKNFEGEANPTLNLARAFAVSCNNSFIKLEEGLPAGALDTAAKSFGFNAPTALPTGPKSAGSYPPPKDDAERAASSIGQGRVLVSPAQMASIAAAIGSGQWHAPVVTTDPKPSPPSIPALAPNIVNELRSFMAGVVSSGGTAAGAGLPAGVIGKTGTAEIGAVNDAWFVGVRGNIAFAVVVEGGTDPGQIPTPVGGQVAAPIAAKFLNALG